MGNFVSSGCRNANKFNQIENQKENRKNVVKLKVEKEKQLKTEKKMNKIRKPSYLNGSWGAPIRLGGIALLRIASE